jgi:hypothetical protein
VTVSDGITSIFPLYKTATLSPDAIQRRTYWTSCALGAALLYIALLPDWRFALFVSAAVSAVVVNSNPG